MINMSKGGVLLHLRDKLSKKNFIVPNLKLFTLVEFFDDEDLFIEKVQSSFPSCLVAIRSSVSDEDGLHQSKAGEYKSVLNIDTSNKKIIKKAIKDVIESYKNLKNLAKETLIVQEMVDDVSFSGVIFTHELNTGAPYYVINYDDQTFVTDTVTSGYSEHSNRILYVHRNAVESLRSERFLKLISSVKELEILLESNLLDIEFVFNKSLQPYLLQVRPISTIKNMPVNLEKQIDLSLEKTSNFLKTRFENPSNSNVVGSTSVFGQMPDWNPAEMIGRTPKSLAFSMYKYFITDAVWAESRAEMGYKDLKGNKLMVALSGQPFIDVRLSLNSFLPKVLSRDISKKLIDFWIVKLKENPEIHDKIEFDLAITCFTFNFDEKIIESTGNLLTIKEISVFKEALRNLTKELVLGNGPGTIKNSLRDLENLNKLQKNQSIFKIHDLIKYSSHCAEFGTKPFAKLARHGFIARSMLLSLMELNILSTHDIENFMRSIPTVTSDLLEDMHKVSKGDISEKDFMFKYGHLRPGTYDITSQRYDQIDDFFFHNGSPSPVDNKHKNFDLKPSQHKAISELLKSEGFIGLTSEELFEYFRDAISGREYGKFVFTKTISAILESLAKFAKKHGLTREQISHVCIGDIFECVKMKSEEAISINLRKIFTSNKKLHSINSSIRFPQIITDIAAVYVAPFQSARPNFITSLRVNADSICLTNCSKHPNLDGLIVIIESADPGYDWIFTHKIAGLVTKYGGANSHMAIRCAEFNIPAAIGCGEQRYETLIDAKKIIIDASIELVNPVF